MRKLGSKKRPNLKHFNQGVLLLIISLVVLWPVIPSAYSADDTFGSFVPFEQRYSGLSPWQIISDVTSSWMHQAGRFFPGAVTIGFFGHYFFPGRLEYKILQLLIALAALASFYIFVRGISKSKAIAMLTCLIALCAMQYKVQYDPIIQFSLQQPSLIILLFLSFTFYGLAVRKSDSKLLLLSGMFYLLAMLTYETSVLLWPVFVLIILMEKPEKWKLKLFSTAIAPVVVVTHLIFLRSKVVSTTAGYTSNFELAVLSRTFVKQLIASVPMSFAEINTPPYLISFPGFFATSDFLMWLTLAVSVGVAMWIGRSAPVLALRTRISLIGIGLTLWFMPAIVVAQTVRWQNEIALGNGYITAYQGYFGFALLVCGVFLQLKSILLERRALYTTVLSASLALVVGISVSSVVVNNPRAVAQYNPGYLWPREHFERAISSGVFSAAREDETIFSSQREWWFNAPFIEWFGGPRLKEVVAPIDEALFGSCMMDVPTCAERLNLTYAFNTFGRSPNETRVTIVGRLQLLNSDSQGITSVLVSYPNFYVEYPAESVGLKESEDRCRSWLTQRLNLVGQNVSLDQVQVISATSKSCRASLNSPGELDLLRFTP